MTGDLHLPGFEPDPGGASPPAPPDPKPASGETSPALLSSAAVPFRVEVNRSTRRRRSVGAHLVGDVLRLAIPSWMSVAEEQHWIDEMSRRFLRRMSADRLDLAERAVTLARRHDLSRPREIRWADDMTTRWGSCTPASGTIRISTRLAAFPDWVIDYVIVHELAHLDVPGHGDDFWRLVHRFPRAERAIGYLIAKSGEVD